MNPLPMNWRLCLSDLTMTFSMMTNGKLQQTIFGCNNRSSILHSSGIHRTHNPDTHKKLLIENMI